MTTAPPLPSLIASAAAQRELQPRNDLHEPGWLFWEVRTLNMHRVVGLLHAYRHFTDAHDCEATIRGAVARHFKPSWWRGMAFGVVADVRLISLGTEDLKILVDGRENAKGTLQWVVLVDSEAQVALGVHTWMEAYLSPVYRNTLRVLEITGYQVSSARKEKDGLLKVLTGVADWNVALRTFGTRRRAFPEFRDDPRRDP
jgi:hypothetical protein